MKLCRIALTFLLAALTGGSAAIAADKLEMKSGRTYEGRIVGEDDTEIKIQLPGGTTVGFDKKLVAKITREAVEAAPNFLPTAEVVLETAQTVAPEEWAQIPATVIEHGILRNVPYRSYRAGKLELNIYGDPAAPAGVEVGIYGANTSVPFKKKLVAFIAQITDAEFPEAFNIEEDKKRLGSIDYEVTPPTAPDAYGAWWISAYDVSRLESARVADNEMSEITTQRAEIVRKTRQAEADRKLEAWAAAQRQANEWTGADLQRAVRPTEAVSAAAVAPISAPTYSTGRVWVRGYYRKDGTYVRGHSRSR